jgi:hypothetical protein
MQIFNYKYISQKLNKFPIEFEVTQGQRTIFWGPQAKMVELSKELSIKVFKKHKYERIGNVLKLRITFKFSINSKDNMLWNAFYTRMRCGLHEILRKNVQKR